MTISIEEMVKRHLDTLPKRKVLPEILDEMGDNIRSAAEAARKGEEAARIAKQAAHLASKASKEAERRAEEAAEESKRAATLAITKAEKVSNKAIKASEKVLLRIESLEQRLKNLEETMPKEVVVVIREISREEAKTEIVRLFKKGKILYYSDIARELSLDLELVVDICEELRKQGEITIDAGVS